MTTDLTTSRPYAQAAYAVARAHNEVEAWVTMLNALCAASLSTAARHFATDPRLTATQVSAVFWEMIPNLNDRMRNFIQLLIENQRFCAVEAMLKLFIQARDADENALQAVWVGVVPLASTQQDAIAQALFKRYGRQVKLTTKVDPTLLGGGTLTIGSRLMDGSIRTQLNNLISVLQNA